MSTTTISARPFDRKPKYPYDKHAILGVGALFGLMLLVAGIVWWNGAHQPHFTIGKGDSLAAKLDRYYFPNDYHPKPRSTGLTTAQERKVYLKTVDIAQACGLPLVWTSLDGKTSDRYKNPGIARNGINTGKVLVDIPVEAGDTFDMRHGKIHCTAGSRTKPFAMR